MLERSEIIPYQRMYDQQEKAEKKTGAYAEWQKVLILGISGFLVTKSVILESLMPFSIPFFAILVLYSRRYIFASLGVIAGMLVNAYFGLNILKYGISFLMIFSLGMLLKKRSFKLIWGSTLTAIMSFISGIIYLNVKGFLWYDFILLILESFICFSLVYIYYYAIPILIEEKRTFLSNEELISIAVTLGVVISGLSDFNFYGYSLKPIAIILTLLVFSYYGGARTGACIGVLLGLINSFSSIRAPYLVGIYAFSGMLAGIFKELGRFGTVLGFVIGNAILTFYISSSAEVFVNLKDVMVSSLIFMLLPRRVLDLFAIRLEYSLKGVRGQKDYSDNVKEYLVERLKEFSKIFHDLGRNLEVEKSLYAYNKKVDLSWIFDRVVKKVCSECSKKSYCWGEEVYNTYQDFYKLFEKMEEGGKNLTIPPHLNKNCYRLKEVMDASQNYFEFYRASLIWNKKIMEGRELVHQQIKGVSEVIENLALDLSKTIRFRSELEEKIAIALDKEGIAIKDVIVAEVQDNKFEITIRKKACFGNNVCKKCITRVVSEIMGKPFSVKRNMCGLIPASDSCSFKLVEAQKFQVATGISRVASCENNISGDNYSFMELRNGKYILALSDGMGIGIRASRESSAALNMLESFLEAGFSKDIAVKTINSIMMLKSTEDTFTTIDLTIIDCYSGIMEMVKIGASTTFIKRREEVEIIRSSSLPVGIVSDIKADVYKKQLKDGDFVVMVTDGFLEVDEGLNKEDWVVKELKAMRTQNPQDMAEKLMKKALEKCKGKNKDDMTVLVAKVWQIN